MTKDAAPICPVCGQRPRRKRKVPRTRSGTSNSNYRYACRECENEAAAARMAEIYETKRDSFMGRVGKWRQVKIVCDCGAVIQRATFYGSANHKRAGHAVVRVATQSDLDGLPEGYRKCTVFLTVHEAARLRAESCMTGPGTMSAAVRRRMGMSESPRGLREGR